MKSLPVIDLFAGAGGFSAGADLAGCSTRLMVEIDPVCCQTLAENHPSSAIFQGPVEDLVGSTLRKKAGVTAREPLIVVGGAPCQPFSKAAYWIDPGDDARFRRARAAGKSASKPKPITKARPDDRRDLILEFERIVRESNAAGFVFENVPSILHPRNRRDFEAFRARLERSGYHTTVVAANAVDFGVPQRRKRIFLLGALSSYPVPPRPTHSEARTPGMLPVVTAGQALAPFSGAAFAEPEERITGRWSSELKEVPPGSNYKALTAWAGHPSPTFEAETRFWNFLLKLSPEAPSWTLAASPGPWTGPFHWRTRRLRTVEMAALQSFAPSYIFAGNRRARTRQIGNAVPPLMAKAMVQSVVDAVTQCRKAKPFDVRRPN